MHTPDMSDEELDALFQRGAEHYPDEHNLSAWLDMERKLDAAAMQRQVRGKVLRIFALETIIILLALLGWFGFSHKIEVKISATEPRPAGPAAATAPDAPATRRPAPTTQPVALVPRRSQAKLNPASATPAPASSAQPQPGASGAAAAPATVVVTESPSGLIQPALLAANQPPRRRVATGRTEAGRIGLVAFSQPARMASPVRPGPEAGAGQAGAIVSKSASPLALPTPAVSAAAESAARTKPLATAEQTAGAVPTRAESTVTGTPLALGNVVTTPDKADSTTPEKAAGTSPAATAPVETTPGPETAATAPTVAADSTVAPAVASGLATATAAADSAAEKPRRKMPAAFARLSIAGLYAPELSTVRWASYSPPGSNLGLLLEYRFASRWRVNVGALRSVKRYAARGSDYHPPAAYWTNYYVVDEVNATCHIIDVPVNLRYDVLQGAQTAVFASVGLSSLLMREETYHYSYLLQDQPKTRDWSLYKGSNHLLSVLNLSAGYEHLLSRRWAAQAEPFVKIPLGGVGFGKVKLSSAGVFFSLKYALLPAR